MNNVIPNDLVSQEFSTELYLGQVCIYVDSQHRYRLNDIHKFTGGENRHQPSDWLLLQRTSELLLEYYKQHLSKSGGASKSFHPINIVKGNSQYAGTYALRHLMIAYSFWINPMLIAGIDNPELLNLRPKKKGESCGHVYVLESAPEIVKIGMSKDPYQRLRSIYSTSYSSQTSYISNKYVNYRDLEKLAHEHFHSKRLRNEFFAVSLKEAVHHVKLLCLEHGIPSD